MRDVSIISGLRAALRRRGVWGPRADRLMQEWTEHVREDATERVGKGAGIDAAREAAWKALGNPEVLALNAGRELSQASWPGRHPWLAGLVLPALAWFVLVPATFYLSVCLVSWFWDIDAMERAYPAALPNALVAAAKCCQLAVNWLPWLFSMAWLVRIAARMPGGWKLFWITAIVLTLLSTLITLEIKPPLHGPHSGALMLYPSGILGVIANALLRVLGYGAVVGSWSSWVEQSIAHPEALVQTAISLAGGAAFYLQATALRKPAGTALEGWS